MYGEDIDNIDNPSEQNADGWTVAMIQARLGKVPEQRFKHDSNIKNKYE